MRIKNVHYYYYYYVRLREAGAMNCLEIFRLRDGRRNKRENGTENLPEKPVSISFPFGFNQHSYHRMLQGLLKITI